MEEYLAFVDEIGRTIDGDFLYRFDFTETPDAVWGEYFNVTPSVIIPNLQPEKETITKTGRVILHKQLQLAKKSGCFSMQDCFDSIIPLAFSDLDEEEVIIFNFAETYEEVLNKLHENGSDLTDIETIEHGDETIIDDLIKQIDDNKNSFTNVIEEAIKDSNESLYKEILTLSIGQKISYDEIKKILYENGYEMTDYIHKKKQYTIRGHIIDIYSIHFKNKYPFRILFFGNEIEEIFSYNIDTQDKIENFNEITIYNLDT